MQLYTPLLNFRFVYQILFLTIIEGKMPSLFDVWLPFIYLYGVGGIFFLVGMIIIKKSGAVNLKIKRHRYWYKVLILGFFYFAALHAFFTILALYW